ncbi:MAG: 7-cyano-7-deazaguanine synthase [Acidobacteriota bacterium]|nr:7-cyano-7-deazaguanine synthase [Acidobacteriota bacterium]
MTSPSPPPQAPTLVLLSGGLDSAVLVAHEAERGPVAPLYVRVGLAWETLELAMVERLLAHPSLSGTVSSLTTVEFTMRDVYAPSHWAIRGAAPAYDTPDQDVYLTGRNLVLLSKAGVVATAKGAHRIALGPLAGNPFPDARPAFLQAMQQALSLGLDRPVEVVAPFLRWEKAAVIQRGLDLGVPLELTLSCMNPVPAADSSAVPRHCGRCSKCRERRDAFAAVGHPDPAGYAAASPR